MLKKARFMSFLVQVLRTVGLKLEFFNLIRKMGLTFFLSKIVQHQKAISQQKRACLIQIVRTQINVLNLQKWQFTSLLNSISALRNFAKFQENVYNEVPFLGMSYTIYPPALVRVCLQEGKKCQFFWEMLHTY